MLQVAASAMWLGIIVNENREEEREVGRNVRVCIM